MHTWVNQNNTAGFVCPFELKLCYDDTSFSAHRNLCPSSTECRPWMPSPTAHHASLMTCALHLTSNQLTGQSFSALFRRCRSWGSIKRCVCVCDSCKLNCRGALEPYLKCFFYVGTRLQDLCKYYMRFYTPL